MALGTHMHRHNGKPFNFMRLGRRWIRKGRTKNRQENKKHILFGARSWQSKRDEEHWEKGRKKNERQLQFRQQVGKLAFGSF